MRTTQSVVRCLTWVEFIQWPLDSLAGLLALTHPYRHTQLSSETTEEASEDQKPSCTTRYHYKGRRVCCIGYRARIPMHTKTRS